MKHKPITAWYDEAKREMALQSKSDVFYYMIYSETAVERLKWAEIYLQWVLNEVQG